MRISDWSSDVCSSDLPWVGHPVAWVRATNDPNRVIPIAIGTDHSVHLARNIYLAVKMMTGVRPDVGVRAMAKFTGIVGIAASPDRKSVVKGKSVSVGVEIGGRRLSKNKNTKNM